MRRYSSVARTDWRDRVTAQGLIYHTPLREDGTNAPYWYEDAVYELALAEVEHMESATEELHRMSVETARYMASGEMGNLGLSDSSFELIRYSLDADPPSLYGRFDFRFDGNSPVKMLEYNGDTPTGLIESSIIQWYWLQDVEPDRDQWNSVHERLVNQWMKISPQLKSNRVHFGYLDGSYMHEEWMTTAYIRDTAMQAGLDTVEMEMTDIGLDVATGRFVDLDDLPIDVMFKLYPWENMLADDFGLRIKADPDGTQWIEPMWKVLLSNKALLAALWRIYPDHEYLLPAYMDDPQGMEEWIAKPLHGREGDGIRVHTDKFKQTNPGDYGAEGYCYQQWAPLPNFDGNYPVIGSWVIDGKSAGCGIRESDGYITDFYARFVPHVIDAPTPSKEERLAWLAE